MITIRNLSKRFGDNPVLSDVSLEIAKGETVVIAGPSGSGKTTLLRCVTGLEKPDAGEVEVDGVCIRADDTNSTRAEKLRQVRLRCGFVFQQFNLFPHLNVLHNLTLAQTHVKKTSYDQARAIAQDLLQKLGLSHCVNNRITKLSGGEQQRVAIARALAMQPEYLLYDEPTSSLDPDRAREIWRLMLTLARDGQTQVIVTHQEELTRAMPCRVVRMESGRIVQTEI